MSSNPTPSASQGAGDTSAPDYLIYHEPQAAALCGVHAVNCLLQGPYIDAVQCAEVAQQLDAKERALMAEAGMDSADFLKFVAEDSSNVDPSGMFSVQVLSTVLESWGLALVPLASPEAAVARAQPEACTAFLANMAEHWFAIRNINGEWWNLNSLFSHPEPLSHFYLAAFLGTLQEQGYTIFLLRGPLPTPDPDAAAAAAAAGAGDGSGRWLMASEARAAAKSKQELKQAGFLKAAATSVADMATAAGHRLRLRPRGAAVARSGSGASTAEDLEDAELKRALEASMREAYGSGSAEVIAIDDEDEDLRAAIAASLAAAPAPAPSNNAQPAEPPLIDIASDGEGGSGAQPASGPALPSLGEEPAAEAEGVLEIGLKLPTGERRSRRFADSDTVGHLVAFAVASGADVARGVVLATAFPRRVLGNWEQSLKEAGVGHKEVVVVEHAS